MGSLSSLVFDTMLPLAETRGGAALTTNCLGGDLLLVVGLLLLIVRRLSSSFLFVKFEVGGEMRAKLDSPAC